MPELPEVHTTVVELERLIVGKTLLNVWSGYDSPHYYGKEQVKDPAYFKKFKAQILGSTIIGTSRIGKNVLIHLDIGSTILVHMKMTGHLLFGNYSYNKKEKKWNAVGKGPLKDDKWNGFIRMVFSFTDSTRLALSDLRKFAKVQLIKTDELHNHPELLDLGPDPLSETFTLSTFKERMRSRASGKIKQVLMDQNLIAGVGNIYSDEALWLAEIHPTTIVKKLNDAQLKKLFRAVQEILKKELILKETQLLITEHLQEPPGNFTTNTKCIDEPENLAHEKVAPEPSNVLLLEDAAHIFVTPAKSNILNEWKKLRPIKRKK